MKRIFIISILFIFCFGCSKDDPLLVSSDISLNPPEWLVGSWRQEETCGSLCHELEISENNVRIISWGGASVFDIATSARIAEAGVNTSASIEETFLSENRYEFIFTTKNDGIVQFKMTYRFSYIDSLTIQFEQNEYMQILKKMQAQNNLRSQSLLTVTTAGDHEINVLLITGKAVLNDSYADLGKYVR